MLSYSCLLFIFQTSELGVTEHIEGDPCKFALWAGRTPSSDNKTVLKVCLSTLKQNRQLFAWVYALHSRFKNMAKYKILFAHSIVDWLGSYHCGWRLFLFKQMELIPQASSIEVKQEWIKNIREVIQERIIHLKGALKEPIPIPKTPAKPRNNSKRLESTQVLCLFLQQTSIPWLND